MKSNIPEEEKVDSIIRDLEKIFQKLFNQLLTLGHGIIISIKKLFVSWKKLLVWTLIGGVIGVSSLLIIPPEYISSIILKTHIDAKSQLLSDSKYLNTLIDANKFEELSEILGITTEKAETIKSVEVNSAVSITERLKNLDKFIKHLDAKLKENIAIADLLKDDEFTFTNKFELTIYSIDQNAFEKIEENLLDFLERVPELNRLRENKLKIIRMQKDLYFKEIQGLDGLKITLNKAMIEQAKLKDSSEMSFKMSQNYHSGLINPLNVYTKVSDYIGKISSLEERIPDYEKCYFVVSHLNKTGKESGLGGLLRSILGAVVFGLIGALIILLTPIKPK